jgi:hypothetical protein
MVAWTYFLLLAIITVHGAFSKRIGGSRFKLFTNKLNSLRLPLSGLFSSISGTGAMAGSIGDRFRGGGGEGSTSNLGAISHKFDVNNDEKNTKQAGGVLFLFSSLLNSYTSLLERSPYPTKMVTSAIIGALGDYLVQKYEGRKTNKAIDLRRLLVFATVCGLYIAPVIHVWFEFLNKMPFLASLGKYSKAFAMMFVDQSVGATVITLGFFFAFEAVRVNSMCNEWFSSISVILTTLNPNIFEYLSVRIILFF